MSPRRDAVRLIHCHQQQLALRVQRLAPVQEPARCQLLRRDVDKNVFAGKYVGLCIWIELSRSLNGGGQEKNGGCEFLLFFYFFWGLRSKALRPLADQKKTAAREDFLTKKKKRYVRHEHKMGDRHA